jgi:hypothetical protein
MEDLSLEGILPNCFTQQVFNLTKTLLFYLYILETNHLFSLNKIWPSPEPDSGGYVSMLTRTGGGGKFFKSRLLAPFPHLPCLILWWPRGLGDPRNLFDRPGED